MTLEALLHLPDGPRRLALRPGEAAVVDRHTVAALADRVDRRDRIRLGGRRLDRRRTAGRVRAGLGLVTTAAVAPDVAVRDHLSALVPTERAVALLADAPLLADRGDDPAGVLSGGERQVLAVLRAEARRPSAVVLDRAGRGLDPTTLAWLTARVAAWRAHGTVVVVRPGRPEEERWVEAAPAPSG